MLTEEGVRDALRSVSDPEIPVLSIVDLGLIEEVRIAGSRVEVDLLPTFTGCPALGFIQQAAEQRLLHIPGVEEAKVAFRFDPAWSTERISPSGRLALQSFGIAPPGVAPTCPYCGSHSTKIEASFGPTRCRSAYYCDACNNPFERMKAI
ncbi:MAG: phenylacetate-CoA oxygenase subunit PaaJ [Thermaerobacter sp.]|nr:phenylacetate-CoA oxygenase subunit PaaJ [Thermaerobacter sp.]